MATRRTPRPQGRDRSPAWKRAIAAALDGVWDRNARRKQAAADAVRGRNARRDAFLREARKSNPRLDTTLRRRGRA